MQNYKDLNAPALQGARGAKTANFDLILIPKLDTYSLAPQVENCSTLRSNDAGETTLVSRLLFFKKLALVTFIEKSHKQGHCTAQAISHGGGFLRLCHNFFSELFNLSAHKK